MNISNIKLSNLASDYAHQEGGKANKLITWGYEAFKAGYKANPNTYTKEEVILLIKYAFDAGRELGDHEWSYPDGWDFIEDCKSRNII